MSSSGSAFPELAADQEAAAAAAPSTTNFTNSQTTTAFSIAAVTHGNSACADNVQAFLQNYQPATLQQQLQAAAPDGLTVDNSAATYDTTHAVPGRSFAQALKSVGATVAASASKGIVPSVVVTPNTQTLSLISLPPIKSSSPLPITVSGFFPGATVDLALTQQCLSIADGQSLGSFTPKTSAEESHDFAIPASLKPGTYSVKATQNNLNWCSQPFDVLAQ